MARLGTGLLVVGLLAMAFGAMWQLGLAPGSRVTLPPPVALERATAGVRSVGTPTPTLADPTPTVAHAPPAATSMPIPLNAADAGERVRWAPPQAARPETGYAVRLAIPSIKLSTPVEQGGIVSDEQGHPIWETLPFVAVHYGHLTSLIGAAGNAVIAGHVVTQNEGNVFRFLYQLEIDDQINVWDEQAQQHDFHVVDVRLVAPDDTSVMAPTADQTLTLITCGGTFDPVKREFSDRLVVTAKPLP